ncbi:hypothetical protein KY308_02970, partial [Candidatus Woesearchaeota archaeon]|nr:hypothetical protein [Candidatus Woesearchaeota archaeon]
DCGPISGTLGDQEGIISFGWKKQDSSSRVYYDVFLNGTGILTPVSILSGSLGAAVSYDASSMTGSDVNLIIVPWINGSRYNGTWYTTNSFRILAFAVAEQVSRGGGGGGGVPIITKVQDFVVTEEPKEVKLIKGTQLNFLLNLEKYSMKVSEIEQDSSLVYILGSATQFKLNEPKSIDLTGDKKPDIIITLKRTEVERALNGETVTDAYFELVKYIEPGMAPSEVIEAKPTPVPKPTVEKPSPVAEVAEEVAEKSYWWAYVLIGAAIIAVTFLIVRMERIKFTKKSRKLRKK